MGVFDAASLCIVLGSASPGAVSAVEKLEDAAGSEQHEVRMKAERLRTVVAYKQDNQETALRVAVGFFERRFVMEVGNPPEWLREVRFGKLTQCRVRGSWVPPALAEDKRVVRAIAQAPNQNMLGTETVNGILSHAWKRVFLRSWAGIVLQAACLMAAVHASYSFRQTPKEQPSMATRVTLLASVILRVVQEVAELHRSCLEVFRKPTNGWAWHGFRLVEGVLAYVFQLANLVDMSVIALRVVGTVKILGSSDDTASKGLVAAFCVQQWLTFLYSLRVTNAVGHRLLPILWAIRNTVVFGVVCAICFMASTNAYYVIGARPASDSEPSPIYAAVLAIYRLGILGDFDIFHLEGSDPTMVPASDPSDLGSLAPEDPEPSEDVVVVHLFFYITSLGMTVILMNLFIGVLGQNYEIYEDQSALLFARERAKVIVELDTLNDLLRSFWGCLCSCFRRRPRVAPWGCLCSCFRRRPRVALLNPEQTNGILPFNPEQTNGVLPFNPEQDKRRLLIIKRVTPEPDEERSLRTVFERELRELKEAHKADLKDLQDKADLKDLQSKADRKTDLKELHVALKAELDDLRAALRPVPSLSC